MDANFRNILTFLQGLLTNKQGMQNSEFGSNLDLQNRALDQRGQQFNANLGLQTQAEKDAAANAAGILGLNTQSEKDQATNAAGRLGLDTTTEANANSLANAKLQQAADQFNKTYGLNLSAQDFAQKMATDQNNFSQGQALLNFQKIMPFLGRNSFFGGGNPAPAGSWVAPASQLFPAGTNVSPTSLAVSNRNA